MDAEKIAIPTDPVELVLTRNEFYRRKYYLALGVYLLSLVVVGVLIGMLVYLIKHPPEPYYFPADSVGRLIKDVPLTEPNMSLDDVTSWTVEAVEAANSYDFLNYRQELQDVQKYFSSYGWYKFIQGLNQTRNLEGLTQRKLIAVAKVTEPPKLIGMGVLKNGVYGYKFEMFVLVTYLRPPYDANSGFQNPLKLSVVVERQNLLQSYKGLGIMQMISVLVTNPNQGALTME